jgi:tyrosine-specific transport protein
MNQKDKEHKRGVISAMFLVAGTCIGGGMLALPIATGIGGFLPSIIMMFFCWLAMTISALLLLEVSLWMKQDDAHIITMASTILGPIGKAAAWALFLFISYASLVAYTAGGGVQITAALEYYANISVSYDFGRFLFIAISSIVISVGSWFVGRVNSILFIGMIAAYFGLVGFGIDEVKFSLLTHKNWHSALLGIPLLLTSFSFQTIVPSLTPYLKRNISHLRIAIIGGTSLAFIIYSIWQWMILGIVPVEGPDGLQVALLKGDQPTTQFLQNHVKGAWIYGIAEYFAFFAIVTSFLGMALGLFDFLADGFKIKKNLKGRVIIGLLIALPTLYIATNLERAFMIAMEATGGFGDTLLNGIIPVLMIWIGRYSMKYNTSRIMPGGKPMLIGVFCFFLVSLVLAILSQAGLITSEVNEYELPLIHNPIEAAKP